MHIFELVNVLLYSPLLLKITDLIGPQIKQLDYRPGRCAVPIFHCARCLDNWQTSGNIPQDCAEPEGLVEGPEIEITTRVFTYIRVGLPE